MHATNDNIKLQECILVMMQSLFVKSCKMYIQVHQLKILLIISFLFLQSTVEMKFKLD